LLAGREAQVEEQDQQRAARGNLYRRLVRSPPARPRRHAAGLVSSSSALSRRAAVHGVARARVEAATDASDLRVERPRAVVHRPRTQQQPRYRRRGGACSYDNERGGCQRHRARVQKTLRARRDDRQGGAFGAVNRGNLPNQRKSKNQSDRAEPHGRRWRPVFATHKNQTNQKNQTTGLMDAHGQSRVAISCRFFDSFDCLISVAGKMSVGYKIAEIKQIQRGAGNQVHAAVWRGNQTNSRVPSPSNQKFFDSV